MKIENSNCTVVITTFFSGDKLEKCLEKIPDFYNKLVIDNGGETQKKKYFENNVIVVLMSTPKGGPLPSSFLSIGNNMPTNFPDGFNRLFTS